MKNIKNIVIGIFAVIGFGAIVTGFTNEAEQAPTFGTPESHVWEMINQSENVSFLYNKKTGEVRNYPIGVEWYKPREKVLKQKK